MRKRLCAVMTAAVMAVLGCAQERTVTPSPVPDAEPEARVSSTFYVANQADFDWALAASGPGDTIIITSGGWYDVNASCFAGGGSCLDGVRIESQPPAWAALNFRNATTDPVFTNTSMERLTLGWVPATVTETITLVDTDLTLVATQLGFGDVHPPLNCQGDVTIDDCFEVRMDVQAGAHVDFDRTYFIGATGQCDAGYTTVHSTATLDVHSWKWAGQTYSYDGLIEFSNVVAMRNCQWGYIRIKVSDPAASVGKVRFGDDDCSQFEANTVSIGNYHYFEVPLTWFPDGDFYWEAEISYCAGSDWEGATTGCKRAKMGRSIPGCPDPLWWPF